MEALDARLAAFLRARAARGEAVYATALAFGRGNHVLWREPSVPLEVGRGGSKFELAGPTFELASLAFDAEIIEHADLMQSGYLAEANVTADPAAVGSTYTTAPGRWYLRTESGGAVAFGDMNGLEEQVDFSGGAGAEAELYRIEPYQAGADITSRLRKLAVGYVVIDANDAGSLHIGSGLFSQTLGEYIPFDEGSTAFDNSGVGVNVFEILPDASHVLVSVRFSTPGGGDTIRLSEIGLFTRNPFTGALPLRGAPSIAPPLTPENPTPTPVPST